MFEKEDIKIIRKSLTDREHMLNIELLSIRKRSSFSARQIEILTKTHGKNYFRTKTRERELEKEIEGIGHILRLLPEA